MCQLQNKKIDGELNKRHTAAIFGKKWQSKAQKG